MLEVLGRVLGVRTNVEYIDNPWSFFQTHTEADIADSAAELGYQPQFSLEAGIERYASEIRRSMSTASAPRRAA